MHKTLLISNFFPPSIGGVENYFYNVCQRLDPAQIVVLTVPHPDGLAFDAKQKYKVIRTEFFSGKLPPTWRPLKKIIKQIIKEEGIEQIIFGHFHPYALIGAKSGLPFYIFGHGTDVGQIKTSWWQKYSLKKCYRQANFKKFVANSNFIAEKVRQLVGDNNKVEVIYPGIDYDGLNASVTDLAGKKSMLGLDDNDIILLSMARVEPEKNYAEIIRQMPELLTRIPQLKYVIVGDGSQLAELKVLTEQLGLKYNVILIGAIPNETAAKAIYYQLAHIFVTVSLKPEGFGISYLEAAATKTATIASKLGGSAEAVKDGETGLLVDPAKPEELKAAIFKLATDNELWTKLAVAGQPWAKGFDWRVQIEKINKILNNEY